jgi:hypothetical protein
MTPTEKSTLLGAVISLVLLSACGSSNNEGAAGGSPSNSGGAGGSATQGSGGTSAPSGGSSTAGEMSQGGAQTATGGGAQTATGGTSAGGSTTTMGGAGGAIPAGDSCKVGTWPAADPTAAGPFATVTENDVGPEAGEADDTGAVPKFTLFRPKDLAQGGLCHPVITWGNGTGATPSAYRSLLTLFASHGFVVIASNNKNVAKGDPKPMLVGVGWVLEQNENAASPLYHRIDATHIGATGHSQGAMATSQAAGDSRVTTNVPIEGAQTQRNLHGPSMFFCGGQDTIVGCTGAQSALTAVTTLPALYAEYLSVDHGSWMSFNGKPSVVDSTVNAWMRVHLMGDESLKSWFYGPACKLCMDSGWQVQQKNMDP